MNGKMISRIYPGAEGLEFFQGLSLVLFLCVFIGVIVVTVTMRKSHSDHMSNLPLDLEDEQKMKQGDQI